MQKSEEKNGTASRKRSGSPAATPSAAQLTLAEIQTRVDALAVAMVAKALPAPKVEFNIRSQAQSQIYLSWNRTATDNSYKFLTASSVESVFAAAEAYVAALPTPEEARMQAFLGALGEAIELGKKADIEVEHVNPLIALMKKLSKNALEHRAKA